MRNIDDLVDDIAREEGWRDRVYLCSAGKETIGFGFLISELNLTKEEGMMILRRYVQEKLDNVSKSQSWFNNLPPKVQDVFINMVFQMGLTGVLRFKKMVSNMKDSNWKAAADEMLDSKWAKKDSPARAKRLAQIVKEHG